MNSLKVFLVLGFIICNFFKGLNAQKPMNTAQALDARQQSIVTISAFMAKGDLIQLQKALNNGLNAGLTINEIKEVLVQLYAYAGFPRSLNAINTLEVVVAERSQKGVKDVTGKEPGKLTTAESRFEFGKGVQTKLTGSTATGAPQKFVPIIDTFLKEHLFADIFGRDLLDFKTREIATISALASLGGAESQLRSHFNVGLNIGLTEAQLKGIVSLLQVKVSAKQGNTANEILQSVLNKTEKTALVKRNNQVTMVDSNKVSANTIFPKGTRISNNNFTGTAWLQMLVNNDTTFNTSIGNVTFERGARTNWQLSSGRSNITCYEWYWSLSGKG